MAEWKADPLESIAVESTDDHTLGYLASKLFTQIRSLKSKPGKSFANMEAIYKTLYWLADAKHLILFKDTNGRNVGVLAFDIVTPWYSTKTCLDEVFVLALDPSFHGFGRVAMEYLKSKAKACGCALMVTGASMTDDPKMVENLYKRHGKCSFSYPCFAWVLPN